MSAPTLPTKPIERAFIEIAGDPSAGIPRGHFEMTLFWDPAGDDGIELQRLRRNISELYAWTHGEPATVTFDFEMEARAAAELERIFAVEPPPPGASP